MVKLAPHPFTLRQLQYVAAVAEHRSFRRAAEACHVAQPSLSAQIAQVEEALGVVLFARDRRAVIVTSAGEALLARIRPVLAGADALVDAARRAGDPLSSTLRLGVIPTIAPYLLPRITSGLRERFPGMLPLWTEDKTPVLAARLADGSLDAAVLALEADLGDVDHAVILHDPFLLATPADHPLAAGAGPVAEEELAGDAMLLLDEGHCLRTQALAWCAHAHVDELAYRATSLGTLVQMVSGGAGITLLPKLAVETEVPRARLAIRPLADPAPYRTVVLAWRARSPLADALAALAAAMGEVAGG